MKLPRDLSDTSLIRCLCCRWEYRQVAQVGSHVTLATDTPSAHRIVIPAHKVLRVGTLNAVLRRVAAHKGVSRKEILDTL